ncbi:NADP-dependent oxidoreductase [Larsenimonas rhizosphaerae]|uniref:NADP-dependent oxidoreductase n=1 Tax=Larsenimonas rhizosphaerae TaxID=2944682 RepID=UPI002033E963|nr:NADP-dependent oxidoreductase [Larsenimonas rhizosphaerae]MCM2130358.1 NADP-dependent oxidoreductase [Larsenimonas rhizosphaerae]
MTVSRYFTITSRPEGLPSPDVFSLEEMELPALGDGELHVRNLWLSVDPYMRNRMDGVKTYIEPFDLNAPLEGAALGEVVESRDERFKPGDKVRHMAGWRDEAHVSADSVERLPDLDVPLQTYLGVLGMPGMTAWTGLNTIAGLGSDDTVLVSAASGAVGSLAVQLAHQKGCRVVGTAGSDEKCDWLKSLGVSPVNHHQSAEALTKAIKAAAPQGIDVYFENVGGPMLDAGLASMNDYGRIAVCGMISRYNSASTEGPANIAMVLTKRMRMQGFIVLEHWADYQKFIEEAGPLVAAGKVEYQESVFDGLEATPEAFLSLFESGTYAGKRLVRL